MKAAFGGWRVLVLGLLGWGLPLLGTDWPQWRGPVRNGHADAAEAALNGLPADPRVIWRLKLGAGWASPVVAAGISGAGVLRCVDIFGPR